MVFGGFGGGSNRVVIRIVGDKSDLDKKLRGAETNVKGFGQSTERSVRKTAKAVKTGFTIIAGAAIAAGISAIKLASRFDSAMSKIIGLVGIAADEVDAMGESVKQLAGETAKSPAELADALFFVTSAGLRGEQALEALEFAAKASAAGLGETAAVADALTSAMNAYAASGLSAEEATNILVATVREGKLEASELGAAIGRVLPIASEMGVTFDEVGASIAAMTRLGLNSAESVTALKSILTTIVKPAQSAAVELEKVGLTSEGLRRQLREEGLLAVLHTLREAFEGNQEALTKVIPNVRALTGFMALTGDAAEETEGIFDRLTDTTGALDTAFEVASETIEFRLNKAMANTQILLLKALPLIETALRELMVLTGEMTELQKLSEISGFDVGSIELTAGAVNELAKEVDGLKVKGKGIGKGFAEGVKAILDESELTRSELDQLADNVDFLREEFDLTSAQAEILKRVLEDQEGALSKLTPTTILTVDAARRLAAAQTDVAESTDAAADAEKILADRNKLATKAADKNREALKKQASAVRDLREAFLEADDPILAVSAAMKKADDLQTDFDEAQEGSIEQARLALELADALGEIEARFIDLGEGDLQRGIGQLARQLDLPIEKVEAMLELLGILDGFEANIKVNLQLERAQFLADLNASLDAANVTVPISSPVDIGGVSHTGGRVNAPRGQEVLIRALGGEEISNPAHDQGGNGASTVINLVQNFERVEGDNIDADIQRGLILAGIARFAETS